MILIYKKEIFCDLNLNKISFCDLNYNRVFNALLNSQSGGTQDIFTPVAPPEGTNILISAIIKYSIGNNF